jgi:hypothetical protein
LRGVDAVVDESLGGAVLVAAGFAAIAFGRRRLGLELVLDFGALADGFGRVVRNAPRTFSSCCA